VVCWWLGVGGVFGGVARSYWVGVRCGVGWVGVVFPGWGGGGEVGGGETLWVLFVFLCRTVLWDPVWIRVVWVLGFSVWLGGNRGCGGWWGWGLGGGVFLCSLCLVPTLEKVLVFGEGWCVGFFKDVMTRKKETPNTTLS